MIYVMSLTNGPICYLQMTQLYFTLIMLIGDWFHCKQQKKKTSILRKRLMFFDVQPGNVDQSLIDSAQP